MEKATHLTSKRHHIPTGVSCLPGLIRSWMIHELRPLTDNCLPASIITRAADFPRGKLFMPVMYRLTLVQSTLHMHYIAFILVLTTTRDIQNSKKAYIHTYIRYKGPGWCVKGRDMLLLYHRIGLPGPSYLYLPLVHLPL